MAVVSPQLKLIPAPVLVVSDCDDDDNSSSCSLSEECESSEKTHHFPSENSQGKDSGIECGPEIPFVPPDEDTMAKIRQAVEYYLSDSNVLKDTFLLKHLRRNKEGYVSLKLIASFRKVKSVSRNWKTVAYSLRESQTLSLNADGTKIRRLAPLPDHDETSISRTVVAYNLPEGKLVSVENVNELFSKCGAISLIRVLKPGGSQPSEIKRFFPKHPDAQSKECGLVEFEQFAGAKEALDMDTGADSDGLRVLSLMSKDADKASPQSPVKTVSSSPKTSPKKKRKTRRSLNGSKTNLINCDDVSSKIERNNRRGSYGYSSSTSSGYLSSSPNDNRFPRRQSYHPSGTYLESSTPSFASLSNRANYRGSRDRINKNDSEKSGDSAGSQSPWVRRRELFLKSESASASFSSSSSRTPAVKIVRLPCGPDDSNGFKPRTHARLLSTAE